MNDHHEAELIGAYVLGALDPDEVADFEAHLATCDACRDELAELGGVATALALAAPPAEPPTRLRRNVLDAIAAPQPARPTPLPRRSTRFGFAVPIAGALALAAVVALAFLGWHSIQLQQDVNSRTAALDRQARVLAALTKHARVIQIPGTTAAPVAVAAVVQPRHGSAYLVVQDLPKLAPSRVYQAWLIKGTRAPVSAGVFTAGHATTVVPLTRSASGFTATAVTVEPGPHGSPAPTGAKVLLGQL